MKTSTRAGTIALSILALCTASQAFAQSGVDLTNEDNRIGYSIGVNIGQKIQQALIET